MKNHSSNLAIMERCKSLTKIDYKLAHNNNQEYCNIDKSTKLAHWPSRYKNGIQLIKSRKVIKKVTRESPVKLSYGSFPKVLNPLKLPTDSHENLTNYGYHKRAETRFQCYKNQSETVWLEIPVPKLEMTLVGKAVSFKSESLSISKEVSLSKISYFKNMPFASKKKQKYTNSVFSPWHNENS